MKEVKPRNKVKNKVVNYYFDYSLLAITILLVAFGLVMLYSISSYTAMIEDNGDMFYFSKQLKFALSGFCLMIVTSKISYHRMGKLSWILYIASLFLMMLVLTSLGASENGASRWLSIGGRQFQPSELSKLAVILFLPYQICKVRETIDRPGNRWNAKVLLRYGNRKRRKWYSTVLEEKKDNWFSILAYGVAASVIILGATSNLSTAIIVGGISLGILVLVSKKGVKVACACVAIVVILVAIIFIGGEEMLLSWSEDSFRMERLLVWVAPENYSQDGGYQILQGLYAIGSGGWFGKGLGNGTQKLTAIPEIQNDYIIAGIIEELGIVGAGIVLLLYLMLLYRLFFIARNAPDMYGGLVVSGIFIHIALQVILNIGVVTAVIPNTGITLPFISYGGTAMWLLLIEIGVALQVSSKIKLGEHIEE